MTFRFNPLRLAFLTATPVSPSPHTPYPLPRGHKRYLSLCSLFALTFSLPQATKAHCCVWPLGICGKKLTFSVGVCLWYLWPSKRAWPRLESGIWPSSPPLEQAWTNLFFFPLERSSLHWRMIWVHSEGFLTASSCQEPEHLCPFCTLMTCWN